MKLGPVTELEKRSNAISNIFDDKVMSENCDVIFIFPIYCQLGVILKPDSGRIVCKTYVSIKSNILSYKNWKMN